MAIQDKVQSIGDYTGMLRRRWPYLATIFPAVVLLSAFLAFSLPAVYRASATILLEPSSIAPELVKTTVISYANQQIELVQRTVLSTDRLVPLVEKLDPYPDRPDMTVRDKAFQIAQDTALNKVDPVTLEPLLESSAFQVHYLNSDPKIAAEVSREIANLFLTHNRETRVAAAQQAQAFLQERASQIEVEMRAIDQKLAIFKRQYGDALPESQFRNEASLDRSQRDLDSINAQIRMSEQQEALLRLQLSQVSPMLVSAGVDAYTQLGLLRSELAAAQQKYTPDHPDVRRLTRAIEALVGSAQLDNPQNVRPDNPDYLRISSQLNAESRNLAALRASAARMQVQSSDYSNRLALAPTVERDYLELARSRETAQQQFQEVQSKLNEASVATTLESQSKGERFTLIREPFIPTSPYEPNRIGLILLGFVLGAALAVGIATLVESSDQTVRSARDVGALSNLAIIGSIPKLLTGADLRNRKLRWGGMALVYSAAVVMVALSVVGTIRF